MASCFDEYQYGYYDYDYSEEETNVKSGSSRYDSEPRKGMTTPRKLKMKRYERKNEIYENVDKDDDNAIDYDAVSTVDNRAVNYHNSSSTVSSDNEYKTPEPMRYSLHRIDSEKRIFVRLAQMGDHISTHPQYEEIEEADLWMHDVAMVFITNGRLEFDEGKVRPIPMYISNYGNFMEAMNEEMMNTVGCQVIGLIEFADNKSYTPRDTDLELVAHTVLVDYDECNSTVCREDQGCTETGHHIYKEPLYLLPYFVRGSPLVCAEQVLSVVNIHSHCDDRRYSADFPSPISLRFFEKVKLVESARSRARNTIPQFPTSRWVTADASQQDRRMMSLEWAFATIVNLIGYQIMS